MKACKNCKLIITEGATCPNCQGTDMTDKFNSQIVVVDPGKSQLAAKIGAKVPGKYAVRIK